MVRNRDPFATALESLRRRLTDGVYGPGAPIVILDEAKRLGLSTTPVREALAWLSGAGLVEHSATGGYLAPRLDAGFVRDGYAFRQACLLMSLEADAAPPAPDVPTTDPAALFAWVVGRGDNAARLDAFQTLELRLGRLVRAERRILGDPAEAIEAMAEAILHDRRREAADKIEAYHRERIAAAAVIVFEATNSPPDQGED